MEIFRKRDVLTGKEYWGYIDTSQLGVTPRCLVFSTPTTKWYVAHNLYYRPLVSTLDLAGNVILASPVHLNDCELEINHDTPTAGYLIYY